MEDLQKVTTDVCWIFATYGIYVQASTETGKIYIFLTTKLECSGINAVSKCNPCLISVVPRNKFIQKKQPSTIETKVLLINLHLHLIQTLSSICFNIHQKLSPIINCHLNKSYILLIIQRIRMMIQIHRPQHIFKFSRGWFICVLSFS